MQASQSLVGQPSDQLVASGDGCPWTPQCRGIMRESCRGTSCCTALCTRSLARATRPPANGLNPITSLPVPHCTVWPLDNSA
jgi:hypothetical protein